MGFLSYDGSHKDYSCIYRFAKLMKIEKLELLIDDTLILNYFRASGNIYTPGLSINL